MLESNAQLIVTPIIVGEYINVYCDIERRAKAPESKRKEFRNSGGFRRVQENVTDNVSQILQYSRYVDSPFPCQDMLRILKEFRLFSRTCGQACVAEDPQVYDTAQVRRTCRTGIRTLS